MRCLPAAVLAIFLAAATGLAAGTLDDLETALNNMELRFWTDIYDLGSGRDFLNNANAVRESEARLRQVFQLTRKLQGELRERGIDPLQFPVAQAGSTLFDIWRQNRNLSNQMRNRRVFRQEQPLSRDHLGMIMMTGVAHRDPEQGDYEAWLSDVAARNTELFYPEPLREWREYLPLYRFGPGAPRKPHKIWYEDALIATANRYFLTLAQLRSQLARLREFFESNTNGRDEPPPADAFFAAVLRAEAAANRVERGFWDVVYKGRFMDMPSAAEFDEAIRQFAHLTRRLQDEVVSRGLDIRAYDVAQAGVTVSALWESDSLLRGLMKKAFNPRSVPLLRKIPVADAERVAMLYSFRAIEDALQERNRTADYSRSRESIPLHQYNSCMPEAGLTILSEANFNGNRRSAAGEFPAWLELTRMRNIEIFSRAAGSDSRLAAVARRYFEAFSRLRRQLYELKRLPSSAAPPK